jgi:predicted adenine nucleotide alpha hydrolase (AANH) superfamily ATPase
MKKQMQKKFPQAMDKLKTNINYELLMQKELDNILSLGKKPTLLLHSCCAPCSSYVLKLLQQYFEITVFFYNSNLYPSQEYLKREQEQRRLIEILNLECYEKLEKGEFEDSVFHPTEIKFKTTDYAPEEFYEFIKGYENEFEGSPRCYLCFMLRLSKSGKVAKENNFDYFCTTLTVSPYKNANWINQIGAIIAEKENIKFLHSDFKKKNGYIKSIEYSKKYNLYRQDYCGCEFSLSAKIKKSKNEVK